MFEQCLTKDFSLLCNGRVASSQSFIRHYMQITVVVACISNTGFVLEFCCFKDETTFYSDQL